MGVVIGETAEIGDDVTLYQGVTLGGTTLNRGKRHPTLEDGVIVGAGAKVLGSFTVGRGARIGANAVVLTAVEAGTAVGGIPARKLGEEKKAEPKPAAIPALRHALRRGARSRRPGPVRHVGRGAGAARRGSTRPSGSARRRASPSPSRSRIRAKRRGRPPLSKEHAMRLTTKGRYAVMAMVDIATHGGGGPVTLAEIAERQVISLSYLEQLFAKLRGGGLVKSVRGPGGGYLLAHGARATRISDIILAVDEPIRATRCTPGAPTGCAANQSRCLTHDLWEELGNQIHLYLSSVTLGRRVRQARARPRPHQRKLHRPRQDSIGRANSMGSSRDTYLDWNATAPLRPRRRRRWRTALAQAATPPRSIAGAAPRARPSKPRASQVAALVHARRRRSSSPAAAPRPTRLALRGFTGLRVLVSAIEHDRSRQAVPDAECFPVARDGIVDLAALDALLRRTSPPALVSLMLANNETGVIQPVAEIARDRPSRTARWSIPTRSRRPGRSDRPARARRRSHDPLGAQDRRPAGRRRGWCSRVELAPLIARRRAGARPPRRHREPRRHRRLRRRRRRRHAILTSAVASLCATGSKQQLSPDARAHLRRRCPAPAEHICDRDAGRARPRRR